MTQPRISIAARTRCGIDASAGRSPAHVGTNQTKPAVMFLPWRISPHAADCPTTDGLRLRRRQAASSGATRQAGVDDNKPTSQHAAVEADRSSRSMHRMQQQAAAGSSAALQASPSDGRGGAVV